MMKLITINILVLFLALNLGFAKEPAVNSKENSQFVSLKDCNHTFNQVDKYNNCTFGISGEKINGLLIGDEQSNNLVNYADLLFKTYKITGASLSVSRCFPGLDTITYNSKSKKIDVTNNKCNDLKKKLIDIVQKSHLFMVVISVQWDLYTGSRNDKKIGNIIVANEEENDLIFKPNLNVLENSLGRTIEFLNKYNIKVLLMNQIPPADEPLNMKCISDKVLKKNKVNCGKSFAQASKYLEDSTKIIEKIKNKYNNVFVLHPLFSLCDVEKNCILARKNEIFYRSPFLLSKAGAQALYTTFPHAKFVPFVNLK